MNKRVQQITFGPKSKDETGFYLIYRVQP